MRKSAEKRTITDSDDSDNSY